MGVQKLSGGCREDVLRIWVVFGGFGETVWRV